MGFFEPDRYFSRITRIDIEKDLLAKGFTHALLDIDNTILTRDTHEVPRDVGVWLGRARDAGITFCLVSNNWHENVYELARELELPIVAKAVKPLPFAFVRALKKIGGTRENTVVIGDQLVTDVLGAHTCGLTAYMLAPLVEQDLPHTLMLRHVERLIMRGRKPEGAPAPSAAVSNASARSHGATAAPVKGSGTAAARAHAKTPASQPVVSGAKPAKSVASAPGKQRLRPGENEA